MPHRGYCRAALRGRCVRRRFTVQVLEYLADLDAGLRQIRRMPRPGGRFIIAATD
jgi:hypothetical protein